MTRRRRRARKDIAQRLHAHRRIRQRFGIEMTREEYDSLVSSIRRGETVGSRETRRVSHHEVSVRGVDLVAVYDTSRGVIVTFLPREWSERRLSEVHSEGEAR